jgi:hypothetical protein
MVLEFFSNFVILNKIKVAKHIWHHAATWWQKLATDMANHWHMLIIMNDVCTINILWECN